MSLHVLGCPNCAQPFQVSSEQAGKVVRCPSCKTEVGVPETLGAAKPAVATEAAQAPTRTPAKSKVFACPDCGGQFGLAPKTFGQKVGCPHCNNIVQTEPARSSSPAASNIPPPAAPGAKVETNAKVETPGLPVEDVVEFGIPKIRKGRKKKRIQVDLDGALNPDPPPEITSDVGTGAMAGDRPALPPAPPEENAEPEPETIGPIKPLRSRRPKKRKPKAKRGPVVAPFGDLGPPSTKPIDTPTATALPSSAEPVSPVKESPLETLASEISASEASAPVKPAESEPEFRLNKKKKKRKTIQLFEDTNPPTKKASLDSARSAASTPSPAVDSTELAPTDTLRESGSGQIPAPSSADSAADLPPRTSSPNHSGESGSVEPTNKDLPPRFSPKKESHNAVGLPPVFSAENVSDSSEYSGNSSDETVRDEAEFGEEFSPLSPSVAVATLLPPRFDVDDPLMMSNRAMNDTKVLLPTADGSTTKVDQRIVTIEHKGKEVQLIALSPEERVRYRRKITIISIVLGVLMLLGAIGLVQLI